MDLGAAGLLHQPFPSHRESSANASYASQQHALKVLQETLETANGLCLLQGPSLSGKSTVIRKFADSLSDNIAVAVVDADKMNTAGLLEAVLRQFGYVLEHGSATELLAMLRVFAMQQTVSQQPPLLIIENTQNLNPGALRALCELAALKVRRANAMKMVLVADCSLKPMLETAPMEPIRKRVTHSYHLRPMTADEAREYLHLKLLVAGCNAPESIFPTPVCTELWRASGGWPGILDRLALLTLSKAEELPVTVELIESPVLPDGTWSKEAVEKSLPEIEAPPELPKLYVTLDGQVRQEIELGQSRLLIGRSEHNDISLPSRFVSRHQAMLVRSGEATFVMDLNSTNGVFVNSKQITNQYLQHGDVISIGDYRIKFVDPGATQRDVADNQLFAETAIMKTLDDMRNLLAGDDASQAEKPTENMPTAGTQL